jgi:hypothetical protein
VKPEALEEMVKEAVERAQPAIPLAPVFNRPLADPALLPVLGQVALGLGYGLV